ncbi:MAG TPA: polymorphic toxin-type HINT domain-containing protein [Saprospiraceae bacterium]|nr:polymorphic toxin-type HINT domain-containing protein [Saprospiraceae bacterium]
MYRILIILFLLLGVTAPHPIFSTTYNDWQHAGYLEIGEEVLARSGNTKVVSKERDQALQPVYNLEVKDLHNFLVGDLGVVVHNTGLCNLLKSFFAKFSKWRKAEPEWALDNNKVQQLMQKMRNGITEFGDDQRIITTTYQGKTYIIDGHHRLKAAKNLKAEGLDIELPHIDIDPAKIGELTGNRFKNIQQLVKESFGPDE